MLFGSALAVAVLMSMGRMSGGAGLDPTMDGGRAARRAEPLAAIDLRLRLPEQRFDMRSLIPKRPPVEVRSLKVVGASGLGFYFPAAGDVAFGVGVTGFKVAPTKRATQVVFGLRVRF